MTKVPMFIIDKLEIRKGKLLFYKGSEFIKHRLCPMTNKNNELVDVPGHTTSWNLGIITFELSVFVISLCLKILFSPYLSMQMRIIDKWKTFVSRFFNHLWSNFLLANAKEGIVVRIIPEDTNARHLLIKGFHVGHLSLMFFVCEMSHNIIISLQKYIFPLN